MVTMLKLPIIKLKLHFKESFPHILTVIILLCAFMYSSIECLYRYFCYWHDHRYKSIFSIHFSFAKDANIAYIFLLPIIQLHSFWCMQQKSYETFGLDKLISNRSTTLDQSRQTMKKVGLEWEFGLIDAILLITKKEPERVANDVSSIQSFCIF